MAKLRLPKKFLVTKGENLVTNVTDTVAMLSPGSEKFSHCLFTFSTKHEFRYFHIAVVQKK